MFGLTNALVLSFFCIDSKSTFRVGSVSFRKSKFFSNVENSSWSAKTNPIIGPLKELEFLEFNLNNCNPNRNWYYSHRIGFCGHCKNRVHITIGFCTSATKLQLHFHCIPSFHCHKTQSILNAILNRKHDDYQVTSER